MNSNTCTIIHIEDDSVWRDLAESVLTPLSWVRKYAAFPTAAEGLAGVRRLRPDCVLLDLNLPEADGFDLAEELARIAPSVRILLMSARTDDAMLARLKLPHIGGLIWKSASVAEQLPIALRQVAEGRKYLPPEVKDSVQRLRADSQAFFKILSDREISLLPLFGLGLSDKEIAERSGLSPLTIKSHRQHIMTKLGLHRAAELVHWAIKRGFVPPALAASAAQVEAG